MVSIFAFKCRSCGELHEGAPSFSFDAPFGYHTLPPREKKKAKLNSDLCIIGEDHFIRVCLEVPIHGFKAPFMWGVWVSLSEKNFERYMETYSKPRTSDECFGWLCNRLPYYPETLHLRTLAHPRKRGIRPYLELEPTDHPLSQDFQNGLSIARAQEIAEHAMHSPAGRCVTASGRKPTKRFLAITALGAIAYLALPMLLIRVGDAYIAKYKFGNAGNDAFERGILLTDLGRAFFAPVAWVADTGAPNWLLLLMIGVICLAAGAALATLACVVARSARAQ